MKSQRSLRYNSARDICKHFYFYLLLVNLGGDFFSCCFCSFLDHFALFMRLFFLLANTQPSPTNPPLFTPTSHHLQPLLHPGLRHEIHWIRHCLMSAYYKHASPTAQRKIISKTCSFHYVSFIRDIHIVF